MPVNRFELFDAEQPVLPVFLLFGAVAKFFKAGFSLVIFVF
jgi:hypothetical protein